MFQSNEQNVLYHPLPVFPSIQRDISLLVNRNVSFAEIKQTIENEGFELLRKVEYVDVYEGKGVTDDSRSVTIRFEYRSNDKTLQEEEIETIHTLILKILSEKLDAKQRF